MKKLFFISIYLLVMAHLFSQKTEIQTITTHNRVTIHTDMSKGIKSFPKWSSFPSEEEAVRKITMRVSLGHPDSTAIAHWDYIDFIYARKKDPDSSSYKEIELGRMITPYGSSFKNDWQFTWEVDVTDFSLFLRDSVEVDYRHTGYEPDHLGWALTIEFEFLYGLPVAKPISIVEIYNGSFPYGNSLDPIENYLTPYSFKFDENAEFGRIRIQQTGHGADKEKLCSEFCSRWREVLYNNHVIDHRHLWKKCGSNPLYPQGGTWIYDRGNWCPGDLQTPDILDISVERSTNNIQFLMEPFVTNDVNQPKEQIAAYLIQYELPTEKHDVAIEDILVPSKNENYGRFNPACFNPVIKIINQGSENLKEVTIMYGTKGFKNNKFVWKGNLRHNEKALVTLPDEVDFKQGNNIFEVTLSKPNGKKDGWVDDNHKQSFFDSPKEMPLSFIVQYKTNNNPEENHIFIINHKKDTVYQRKPEHCAPNQIYSDTLTLAPGKYEMSLTDSGGNGLEFWANSAGGYGYLRLLDLNHQILHHFISDCGNGQFLAFNSVENPKTETLVTQNSFFLYPRRTKQNITLDAFVADTSKLKILFSNEGVIYQLHEYTEFNGGALNFDLESLQPGRYIVEIYINDELIHRNRINKE